jgi:hypothetical protein
MFDGDLVGQLSTQVYSSAELDGTDWMYVDLGTSYVVTKVVYTNRQDCCQNFISGTQLQLLDAKMVVTDQRVLDSSATQTFTFASAPSVTLFCETSFEGGGWALVRRTPGTSIWHQATDDLAGTAVYGTYGTATSNSMFSIAWNTWSFSEMLFMTGMLF